MQSETIAIRARNSIRVNITVAAIPTVFSVPLETVVELVEPDVERKIPIALLTSKV